MKKFQKDSRNLVPLTNFLLKMDAVNEKLSTNDHFLIILDQRDTRQYLVELTQVKPSSKQMQQRIDQSMWDFGMY